jgi:hypothetical protein
LLKTIQILPASLNTLQTTTSGNVTNPTDDILNEIKKLSLRMQHQETVLKAIETTLPKISSTPPTFAQATAAPRPVLSHNNNNNRTNRTPLRFIVRFRGNPPPHTQRLPNERATRRINDKLQEMALSQDLLVLGAVCKPNGNYVVTYSATSSETKAEENKGILSDVLAPNHPSVSVARDIPWTRAIVHGISVQDDNFIDRTEQSINDALKLNPVLDGIQITQTARWIIPPDRLKDKKASSVTFGFIDPQSSIVNELLNHPFHMFGSQVRVTLWQNIPRPAQCKKCWKHTHNTQNCRSINPRCRKCGKVGTENEHQDHCETCKNFPHSNPTCTHVSCANCRAQDHCADDPKCPKFKDSQPRMARSRGTNTRTARPAPTSLND